MRIVTDYDQSLDTMLVARVLGCFRFRLWRFGEWTDVTVDDFLPTLDGTMAYFPAIPPTHEFWGALLEKAYAK